MNEKMAWVGERGPECVIMGWPGYTKPKEYAHPWDEIEARHSLLVASTMAAKFWVTKTVAWSLFKFKERS